MLMITVITTPNDTINLGKELVVNLEKSAEVCQTYVIDPATNSADVDIVKSIMFVIAAIVVICIVGFIYYKRLCCKDQFDAERKEMEDNYQKKIKILNAQIEDLQEKLATQLNEKNEKRRILLLDRKYEILKESCKTCVCKPDGNNAGQNVSKPQCFDYERVDKYVDEIDKELTTLESKLETD